MAKRIYKEKVYPIEVQVRIQQGIVAQNETALEQAVKMAEVTRRTGNDFLGHPVHVSEPARLDGIVASRREDLEIARRRLAELEAQIAA